MIRVIEIKALPDPELVSITVEQDLPNIPGYRKNQERVTGYTIGSINYHCRIGDVFDHTYLKIITQGHPFGFDPNNYDIDIKFAIKCFQFESHFENGLYYKYQTIEIKDTSEALQFLKDNYYEADVSMGGDNSARNRYVTNATASSMARYAMVYLNTQGYTPSQIYKLRKNLSLDNLNSRRFTIEELLLCFEKQSAYFLNLYKEMNENDRFENHLKNLSPHAKALLMLEGHGSIDQIAARFRRQVFHKHVSRYKHLPTHNLVHQCESIHNDYDENGVFHANTKVFGSNKETKFYVVTEDYLKQLGMGLCKNCQGIDDKQNTNSSFYSSDADNDLPF
ncbi:hypothetical protein JAO76_12485 [Pontibacter sp. BT310]|uniref:Uncharacterized protein n=1 Tax=Pontibacter populi TaxID=890055 RepID=A0ABS6XFA2_9BACT|nr:MULTISPECIES: hypothetical protein [Pontibacter]MBJ6119016.1 hypothetical protein [Pontibacter sp. BT310]MBR0571444.1 hypothetical protein [Microvirga sp. STS03]MBW3365870.1 hypothetical protein [Pontibacter populi]